MELLDPVPSPTPPTSVKVTCNTHEFYGGVVVAGTIHHWTFGFGSLRTLKEIVFSPNASKALSWSDSQGPGTWNHFETPHR